jgi:hypothetical protein
MPWFCANDSISCMVARLPINEPVIDIWCTTSSSGSTDMGTSENPITTYLPLVLRQFCRDVQSALPCDVYSNKSKLKLTGCIGVINFAPPSWSVKPLPDSAYSPATQSKCTNFNARTS